LPIRLHDAEQVPSGAEPWTYYPWTQTGLYLFEVPTRRGEERIEEAGSLIVADSASGPEPFTALGADRSVLVDDTVHYVHGGKTWTSVWDDTGIFYGPE
jgi:hypothetical protein